MSKERFKIITNGNCVICGKKLTNKNLFLCDKCKKVKGERSKYEQHNNIFEFKNRIYTVFNSNNKYKL